MRSAALRGVVAEITAVFEAAPCGGLAEAVSAVFDAHPAEFFAIIENASRLIGEIAQRPDEVALRLLRVNNEQLQADLLAFPASVGLLRLAGFQLATTADVEPHLAKREFWQWPFSAKNYLLFSRVQVRRRVVPLPPRA